jgi:hypothetical protein
MILLLRSGASADRRKCFRLFSDGGDLPSRRYANPVARIFKGDGRRCSFSVRSIRGLVTTEMVGSKIDIFASIC